MLTLGTVFPYGLRDGIGDGFVRQDTYALVGSEFSLLPITSTSISQVYVHKLSSSHSPDEFLCKFNF